jgi:hypothetical protein
MGLTLLCQMHNFVGPSIVAFIFKNIIFKGII